MIFFLEYIYLKTGTKPPADSAAAVPYAEDQLHVLLAFPFRNQ